MHTHDRTLLAKLGFTDPDKKNRVHDLACRYVASSEVANSLGLSDEYGVWEYEAFRLEHPISKGTGQYKTTIGFLDCVLIYKTLPRLLEQRYDEITKEHYMAQMRAEIDRAAALEVKITPVAVTDVLRQIHLYREFVTDDCLKWLVVTAFPYDEDSMKQLEHHDIQHFELGDNFHKWAKEQEARQKAIPHQSRKI